jgi:hypothetical protein
VITAGKSTRRTVNNMTDEELEEKLADLMHEAWMRWSKSMIDHLLEDGAITSAYVIRDRAHEKHQRWLPMWVPYNELSEELKDLDRKQARKILEVVRGGKE